MIITIIVALVFGMLGGWLAIRLKTRKRKLYELPKPKLPGDKR